MGLIDKIAFFCQVKNIPHEQVEEMLFKKFSMTGKVSVDNLSEILHERF